MDVIPLSLLFCFAVIYGALCDVRTFTIPNWISVLLVFGFAVFAAFRWGDQPLRFHLLAGAITFAVCVILWKLRMIGGGDVKFLSAIMLWMGPNSTLPFLFSLGIGAAAFAVALMWLRRWNPYIQNRNFPDFIKTLSVKAGEHALPYGLPIAIAALIVVPHIFGPEPITLPHLPPLPSQKNVQQSP